MRLRAALVLLPAVLFAQTPQEPPPGIDQALRARVTEFFQDLVDGKFREAMDLVADDTKDEYFNSAKTSPKAYVIQDVKYSDNFTKAVVTLQIKRVWTLQQQQAIVDVPMTTTWKQEKDKWVWHHDVTPTSWPTPMGPSDSSLFKKNPDGMLVSLPPAHLAEEMGGRGVE